MGKRDEKTIPRQVKQPPRYRFFLNPYRDVRFNKCPQCSNKMGQRRGPAGGLVVVTLGVLRECCAGYRRYPF